MKILLINNVYKKGSTGKIVDSLFHEFKKENDVYLIYGRGSKVNEKNVFKKTFELESKIHHFFSLFTGNMFGGMFFSTQRIIRTIKKIKPDVINLHCLNGYFVNIYLLLKWLSKNNVKTVMTMHADFMMTGGCGYAIDCKNYLNGQCLGCKEFKNFNSKFSLNRTHHLYLKIQKALKQFNNDHLRITCVSKWLADRYAESPLYKDFCVKTILNPVDSIFFNQPNKNPYSELNKNVLYVTPDIYDYVKCGWRIIDIANKRKDINFTVICTKNIEFKFENKNINYIKGGVQKDLLRDYYYFADATLIISKRETFSMVVAESLASGTPVYGFKCGGPESIGIPEYSFFFDYGDIDSISESLLTKAFRKEDIVKASAKYDSSHIAGEYLAVYRF